MVPNEITEVRVRQLRDALQAMMTRPTRISLDDVLVRELAVLKHQFKIKNVSFLPTSGLDLDGVVEFQNDKKLKLYFPDARTSEKKLSMTLTTLCELIKEVALSIINEETASPSEETETTDTATLEQRIREYTHVLLDNTMQGVPACPIEIPGDLQGELGVDAFSFWRNTAKVYITMYRNDRVVSTVSVAKNCSVDNQLDALYTHLMLLREKNIKGVSAFQIEEHQLPARELIRQRQSTMPNSSNIVAAKATAWLERWRPGVSNEKQHAFVNSVVYAVTESMGPFPGPTVREHAMALEGPMDFANAVARANELVLGPLTEEHRALFDPEQCQCEDPEDLKLLTDGTILKMDRPNRAPEF